MNFALGAVIIFILLLPGGTILKAYYSSVIEKKSSIHIALNDLIARGLALSFFIHAVFIFFLTLTDHYPRMDLLYVILSGQKIEGPTGKNHDLTKAFLSFSFLQHRRECVFMVVN